MQISIGIKVKVIEVQCATVSQDMLSGKLTKSAVNKHKHDDDVQDVEDEGPTDDRDPGHPSVKSGAAAAKKVKFKKLKEVGRPNRARQANGSNLWEALKAGINLSGRPIRPNCLRTSKQVHALLTLLYPFHENQHC